MKSFTPRVALLRGFVLLGLLLFLCAHPAQSTPSPKMILTGEEEVNPWVIVVYSSADRGRAEAAARQFRTRLPEQDIEILLLMQSRTAPYRVAIGSFPSLESAKSARSGMRGLPGDAWFWEVPPHAVGLYRPLSHLAVAPVPLSFDKDVQMAPSTLLQPAERARHRPSVDLGGEGAQEEGEGAISTASGTHQSTVARKPARPNRGTKQIAATRLNQRIQMDGKLTEAVWQEQGTRDFRQRSPQVGAQPSEETEVWVAYDDDALYVAARCYDRTPSRISSIVQRRDSDAEADWFSISIDTYRDHRTGFFFLVTSGGSIQDGTIYDEVHLDRSWDGIWERGTAIDSLGWGVEMRIPFAQLKFDPEQVWGVNFARRIHHTNEVVDFLAPRGRKVTFFADLVGLQDIHDPVQLEVIPYVTAQAETYEANQEDPFQPGQGFGSRVGGDVKVRLNSSLALDGTINPDFGQVEVDPAVINLTAQETFFEEKRPFFLEDARFFEFGNGRGRRFLYSRRMGQAPPGTPIHSGYSDVPEETRILGAAKLSGKASDTWRVGWLNVVTAREFAQVDSAGVRFQDEVAPLSYYNVVRLRHERNEGRQAIGFFGSGVWRDLQQEHLQPILNGQAVVAGVDGWTTFGKRGWWRLEGWSSVSHVRGDSLQILRLQEAYQRYYQRPDATHLRPNPRATSLTGAAGEIQLNKRGGNFQIQSGLKVVTPGFDLNDVGYLLYADQIAGDFTMLYGQWQPRGVLNRGFIGLTVAREYNFGWTRLSKSYTIFSRTQFVNFWNANLSMTFSPEGVDVRSTRGGPSMAAPAGWTGYATVSTNSSKPLVLTLNGTSNRDLGGSWSYSLGSDLTWRPSEQLTLSIAPWWSSSLWEAGFLRKRYDPLATDTYNLRNLFASLSQDYFSTDLRMNWAFTPKLSLQTYFQFYSATIRYDRFKELAAPGTFDFHVYGEGSSTISEQDEYGGYAVDPDGEGDAAAFTIYDPNFDFASLRGTSVLRWEYRRGSTLFLVWTHDRFTYTDFWRQPDGGLLSASPFNKFAFKLTFWLSP